MPDVTKYSPSAHGESARYISGSEILCAESRVKGLENISLPSVYMQKLWREGRVAIYRPFGEFLRAKSYCHLYGAQGLCQLQAYF
ncbi:hypothetical protein TNCV_150191 [Trichonephila clavipes]|nr:hypothetical protein TNCV_150191 [Trichonephila clavipes]